MKETREITKLHEAIRKYLKESRIIDISFVLLDIKKFNRKQIDIDELVKNTIKNLRFKLTPINIKNTHQHFVSFIKHDKIPVDSDIVKTLISILR